MTQFIKEIKAEAPYIRPTTVLLLIMIKRFLLNIPMATLWVAIWIAERIDAVKTEISLTRKLIELECRYSALTRDIKKALGQNLGQKPKLREGL